MSENTAYAITRAATERADPSERLGLYRAAELVTIAAGLSEAHPAAGLVSALYREAEDLGEIIPALSADARIVALAALELIVQAQRAEARAAAAAAEHAAYIERLATIRGRAAAGSEGTR
jgi:hypothetical protein